MNISQVQARAIIEVEVLFDLVKAKYPETAEDMSSWKVNNNCSCGTRFLKFLNEKYINKDDKIFLDSILSNKTFVDKVKELEDKNREAYKQRLYSGKIIRIDKSEDSWAKLAGHLNGINAIYKNFCLRDIDSQTLEVRFL
ncbi:MAG: hypothetical protein EBU90_12945 [Proteobacteria bacterium]|nr:hypothetical protein [Pseudomonadota bacterium]